MIYKLCPHEVGAGMIEIDAERHEVEMYVQEYRQQLQRFADSNTGLIAVWAVEFGCVDRYGREKATGALYEHSQFGLIWIEID